MARQLTEPFIAFMTLRLTEQRLHELFPLAHFAPEDPLAAPEPSISTGVTLADGTPLRITFGTMTNTAIVEAPQNRASKAVLGFLGQFHTNPQELIWMSEI